MKRLITLMAVAILGARIVASAAIGAGYAVGNAVDTGYHHGFQLWNYFGSSHDNLALSFSIHLGICF